MATPQSPPGGEKARPYAGGQGVMADLGTGEGRRPPIEILAPVGGPSCLQAAVWAGADSVYLGLQGLNARRGAENFTPDQLAEAVAFCHGHGVKVYVTLNTLVHTDELPAVCRALQAICAAGADALLVQDWAVAALARRCAPGLALHASTQLAVTDLAGALLAAEQGFSRVVLARELSAPEIAHIARHCGIETEVFVHGAQCMGVSGQCYLSAFLGGRSGNRGGCAQPCRQPCTAFWGTEPPPMPPKGHDLSLKDLSLLPHLPRLQAMGVTSAKIEGRLRPPEYVAAAVHAACLARAGQPYDRALLEQVFSRSGFTDGYFQGRRDGTLFGVRRPEDLAATRAAEPAIRAYYRRPLPRVPVKMTLSLEEEGARLTVDDGSYKATVYTDRAPAATPPGPTYPQAVSHSLAKTGGTPFFSAEEEQTLLGVEAYFLPLAEVNALRRRALAALYAKRAACRPVPFCPPVAEVGDPVVKTKGAAVIKTGDTAARAGDPTAKADAVVKWDDPAALLGALPPAPGILRPCRLPPDAGQSLPGGQSLSNGQRLLARLSTPAQLPPSLAATFAALLLPLAQWQKLPDWMAEKAVLELPRGGFGDTDAVRRQMADAARHGFCRFEANGPGQLWQAARLAADGLSVGLWGGFALNILNPLAARQLLALGVGVQTLSCELRLAELPAFAGEKADFAVLGYGRLPLMLTRACPLQSAGQRPDCAGCPRQGQLLDRKGEQLPIVCQGAVREIYNPVPLWLGDRQARIPCRAFVLRFLDEPADRVAKVTELFCEEKPFDGRFTRGLYYAPRVT